jgi:hypothetical protein
VTLLGHEASASDGIFVPARARLADKHLIQMPSVQPFLVGVGMARVFLDHGESWAIPELVQAIRAANFTYDDHEASATPICVLGTSAPIACKRGICSAIARDQCDRGTIHQELVGCIARLSLTCWLTHCGVGWFGLARTLNAQPRGRSTRFWYGPRFRFSGAIASTA